MKLLVVSSLLVSAAAFNFGGKAAPAKKKVATSADGTVATPARWSPAFGDFGALAERQAARAAKIEAEKEALIPTPLKFQFAFGNPAALKARQAERLAKWEWSDSFLARARPDKNNYGAGLSFKDDDLTVLERKQIAQGKEAYLTGGAKIKFKALQGTL